MALTISPSLLDSTYVGFNTLFQRGLTRAQAWSSRISTLVPSTTGSNTYAWLKSISGFREWVGERRFDALVSRGTVIENKDYEKSIKVPRNAIQDEQLGIFGPMFEMMGQEAGKWPDKVMAGILKGGTTGLAFDGQPFFHNSHPVDMDDSSRGTYSNNLTGTALTPENFGVAYSSFVERLNEAGEPMGLLPDLLVVPPRLREMAKRIVESENLGRIIGTTAVADSNPNKGLVETLMVPELADQPDTWYLMCTSLPIRPFIWQLRQAPQMFAKDAPSDPNVLMNKEFLYLGDARGNGGYAFPFLALRATA